MNRAFVFLLKPNNEQKQFFEKTFGCCRKIFNLMLADKINYYKEHKKMLHNTPSSYKKEFTFLKEVDSLALANTQLNLESAFRIFFQKKNVGFPKFKSKKRDKKSYTTNNQKNNIRIENNKIKLPKIGFVKIKQHRTIPENYKLKSCTVSQKSNRKFYISILFEFDKEIIASKIKSILGLDFSMSSLFVDSNGNKCNYPKYYKKSEKKLAKKQRILSKMKRNSNNYKKQKTKIAKLHFHIANQRKDFLHKKSFEIANHFDLVCIENLNMKSMSQTLRFGKSVSDNG